MVPPGLVLILDADADSLIAGIDEAGRGPLAGGSTVAVSAIDISALTDSAADITTLNEYVAIADEALADIVSASSSLGASKARVSTQSQFIADLSDAISKGVGALVDADMEEASARLQALQTQQQLGIQSLSIANQAPKSLLSLFRG